MNIPRDPDTVLAAWLEDGPLELPRETRQAIAVGIRTVPRRRPGVGWPFGDARLGQPNAGLRRLSVALGSAAVVVVVAALALNFYANQQGIGGPVFQGTWVSTTDADGGTQTMTVRVSAGGAVEIVVRDDVATVCSFTSSTMTGTGRIEGGTQLVIPAPVYTCDDGSEPQALSGPPLDEQLRNWTLFLDPETDTLSDGVGGLWLREGAELPSPDPTTSGGMWPQTSLEEVRQAQKHADAGDPDYTWQVDPRLTSPEWWAKVRDEGPPEVVARFLRQELGWDAFLFNPFAKQRVTDGVIGNLVYLQCAPGETNPLYPVATGFDATGAERCAPTIDGFRYETVSLDLSQLERRGPYGIWVVSRWATAAPFTQAEPRVIEAQATERLEDFLRARIEGEGAEGLVGLSTSAEEVPLLYGTTTGAPYERSEIERVGPPVWPYGWMEFVVRLFADDGETVVEQPIALRDGSLYLAAAETTENGQPVVVTYSFFDGEVTFAAADPWKVFGGLVEDNEWGALTMGDFWSSEEGIELVACEPGPAPENAQALARSIQSDPDHVATAPVDVRVGGVEGLVMDVTIAAATSVCGASFPSAEVVTKPTLDEGIRMRLYLLDLPEGSSERIVVIAIEAPEARFDAVIEAAAPIIESIEFHAP
ncbi:MAG: hypothetical protein HW391_41 [Chloroflexi bacterium]|nr:hypothetical protein [Chloroflexota bacterium]